MILILMALEDCMMESLLFLNGQNLEIFYRKVVDMKHYRWNSLLNACLSFLQFKAVTSFIKFCCYFLHSNKPIFGRLRMARKYTKLFKMWFLFPLESGRITSLMTFARMDWNIYGLRGWIAVHIPQLTAISETYLSLSCLLNSHLIYRPFGLVVLFIDNDLVLGYCCNYSSYIMITSLGQSHTSHWQWTPQLPECSQQITPHQHIQPKDV